MEQASGNPALGWAARDATGVLSPYGFSRRFQQRQSRSEQVELLGGGERAGQLPGEGVDEGAGRACWVVLPAALELDTEAQVRGGAGAVHSGAGGVYGVAGGSSSREVVVKDFRLPLLWLGASFHCTVRFPALRPRDVAGATRDAPPAASCLMPSAAITNSPSLRSVCMRAADESCCLPATAGCG
ncbi:hypothetical protein PR202_gb22691 [Eleusine coracana subsp. coracana]|uniref:Uncharacterized protein n=1 Tax=Eleusine coracana subsp. coracana TaxID=191504 RepID=A0AAV5FH00_ELECO|nr:hypothetical protein PR202_gb22691 [Eleusine coracana subsp. coracana]